MDNFGGWIPLLLKLKYLQLQFDFFIFFAFFMDCLAILVNIQLHKVGFCNKRRQLFCISKGGSSSSSAEFLKQRL
jgi:hypothetical protein